MQGTWRAIPMTVLAAALAVTAAACGNSSQSGTASPAPPSKAADPLASLPGGKILTEAMTNTVHAPAMHIVGTGSDSGQTLTFSLTLVHGVGCEGTLSEGKNGSFQIIDKGGSAWILPDKAFWKSAANGMPASVLSILQGKYLSVKPGGSGLGGVTDMCVTSQLLGGVPKAAETAGTVKGAHAVIGGQPALKLSNTAHKGYIYVSDVARPLVLSLSDPTAGGGTLTFSYPATPVTITAPPASQVIDGSKYGF